MDYKLVGADKSFKTIGSINNDAELNLNRNLIINNHSSEVGYTADILIPSVSLAIGTNWTDIGVSAMPDMPAGVWLLMASVSFQADQDGNRAIRWYNWTDDEAIVSSEIQMPACSGATTRIQSVCTVNIPTPYKIIPQVWQNSDARLNVSTRIRYTRIA